MGTEVKCLWAPVLVPTCTAHLLLQHLYLKTDECEL